MKKTLEAGVRHWKTWMSILAVAVALSVVAVAVHGRTWTASHIAGMAIAIPAFCLWALARWQLGESFAIRPRAKTLVTHGLYSKIENPVYLFGAMLIAGVIVFLGRPSLFLVFFILIPLQLTRIRKERAALEAGFGDEYRRYRQSTWF